MAEAAEASRERLQGVVRLLLRQYLEFAVRWAANGEAIAERFRLPARAPLPVAYNKVLEALGRGEQDARDLLTFSVSHG